MLLLSIETIITFLFLLYVQFSPQMGNIWWRGDYFSPMGAIELMKYPFREPKMWNLEFWDVNYFIWVLVGIFVYTIIKLIYLNIIVYINNE